MSASKGFLGKYSESFDRKTSEVPENIGNRKTFQEIRIPPDNVGNIVENDPIATFIHDSLGNCVDEEPSHLKSGILPTLGRKERGLKRSRDGLMGESVSKLKRTSAAQVTLRPDPKKPRMLRLNNETMMQEALHHASNGEHYMARLIKEFAKLLNEKSGLAFSFSMKPLCDHKIDEEEENQSLLAIRNVITEVLSESSIDGSLCVSKYKNETHRFAVFFVNPTERDPAKNKELISALRQVVKLYSLTLPLMHMNILLVLANAQAIIEAHLSKLGAKKVE